MLASFGFLHRAVVTVLTSVAIISGTAAQSTGGAGASTANPPPESRTFRVPRNLKVLPRDLLGQQVNSIMEDWSRSLGVRCDACHAEATETLVADDNSNLNFADDSKPMKTIARSMCGMTEEINNIYIAKIEGSGIPVTCGTCHRGNISPEPAFVPPAAQPSSSQAQRP